MNKKLLLVLKKNNLCTLALKGTKKIMNMLLRSNQLDETQIKEAQSLFKESLFSEDMQEGQAAFLEKRETTCYPTMAWVPPEAMPPHASEIMLH